MSQLMLPKLLFYIKNRKKTKTLLLYKTGYLNSKFQIINLVYLIKLQMSFEHQASSNNRGQGQIRSIKRGFLHNILQYNIAISNYKSKQRQAQQQKQTQYAQVVNKNLQRQFARIQQQKRKRKIQQKQSLKREYESQIKQKQLRRVKQKYMDKNFAKNQQEYLNFRNQRRMAELMRIYNRKSYQGILPSDKDYSSYPTKETSSRHVRFKTQPLQNYYQNPEVNYNSSKKVENVNGSYYKDSLDQLQKVNRQDIVLKKYSQQYRNP